jgi:Family of unknown function (DUF5565)
MRKIPTLFVRDFDGSNGRYVLPEVTPGCEWVLAGEGSATRKYDGTCVLIRHDETLVKAFARREVKAGKQPPTGFVLIETDETTGKSVGWEPAEQSGYAKYIAEVLTNWEANGTYELVGPKVQGNPEHEETHRLVPHGAFVIADAPRDFDGLRDYLTDNFPFEGIVWHHPDGRMAKLKVRDFAAPLTDGGRHE